MIQPVNETKKDARLFITILGVQIFLELFVYQYVGKDLFGGLWVSDNRREHTIHLIWMILVTTPLLFTLVHQLIRKERAYSKKIWNLAHYDELTGVYNRRYLMLLLQDVIDSVKCSEQRCALLFVDLDRFKQINDSLGHDIGDKVLKIITERLLMSLRDENDALARLGGDEFVVLLPRINDTNDAINVAKRILNSVQEVVACSGYEFLLTASVGVALYPTSGDSVTTMLKSADLAMYEAKRLGKNRFYVHLPSLQGESYSRLKLEMDLRKAVTNNQELFMEYQPQIDVQSGLVVGIEALVRWKHSSLGVIPPSEFIPIAEELGLMEDLGRYALKMVCETLALWRSRNKTLLPVGINASQVELSEPGFVDHFLSTLEEYEIPSTLICLEITETTMMKDAAQTRKVLDRLQAHGVRIVIDDFGQGYNSLALLRQLPIDVMKIDRAFVKNIHTNFTDSSIFSALVSLAHTNDIRVIAEGVEHDAQFTLVKREGCEEYQGYFFSGPIQANEFENRYL